MKIRRPYRLSIGVSCLALAAEFATAVPSGSLSSSEVLRRVAARYAALGTFQAEFTQTYVPQGFKSGERENGVVTVEAPRALRFDYRVPETKVFVLDGDQSSFYTPSEGQIVRKKLDAEERTKLGILFFSDLAGFERAWQVSARETAGSIDLRLVPRVAGELKELQLRVIPGRWEIERVEYLDSAGNRTSITLTGLEEVAKRSASYFRIEVPEGTEVVDY